MLLDVFLNKVRNCPSGPTREINLYDSYDVGTATL